MSGEELTWRQHQMLVAKAIQMGDHAKAEYHRSIVRERLAAKAIQQIIDKAPPLTPEARDRLADLLRGDRTDMGHVEGAVDATLPALRADGAS